MAERPGCLVCGSPLRYRGTAAPMACAYCGRTHQSPAACANAAGASAQTRGDWVKKARSRAEQVPGGGGPRCRRRETFTPIEEAVAFARAETGVVMASEESPRGEFHEMNRQCLGADCPCFPAG